MRKGVILGTALLLLLVAVPALAQAVGPVLNHCNASWTASSPSTDVVSYRIYFAATSGGVGVLVGTVTAPTTAWSCPSGTAEGQKYAYVTAVDAAGNESARSNEFPFVLDVTVPPAASNFKVQ